MPITALPPPPARKDLPEVFVPKVDAFLAALPLFVSEANAVEAAVDADAANALADAASALASRNAAQASQTAAANSAAQALAAPNTSGTSVSNVAIGLGGQAFTTQVGKAFAPGQQVVAVSNASPDNYMLGTVTSYVSGTGALQLNVTVVRGAGTFADWTLAFLGSLPPPPAVAGHELTSDGASWVAGASAYACLAVHQLFSS